MRKLFLFCIFVHSMLSTISCVSITSETHSNSTNSTYDKIPNTFISAYSMVGHTVIECIVNSYIYRSNYNFELYRYTNRNKIVKLISQPLSDFTGNTFVITDTPPDRNQTYTYFTILREKSTGLVSSTPNEINVLYTGTVTGPKLVIQRDLEAWTIKLSINNAPSCYKEFLQNDTDSLIPIELSRKTGTGNFITIDTVYVPFGVSYYENNFVDTVQVPATFSYRSRYILGDTLTSDYSPTDTFTFDPRPDSIGIDSVINYGKYIRIIAGYSSKVNLYRTDSKGVTVLCDSVKSYYSSSHNIVFVDTPSTIGTFKYSVRAQSMAGVLSVPSNMVTTIFTNRLAAPAISESHTLNIVSIKTDHFAPYLVKGYTLFRGKSPDSLKIIASTMNANVSKMYDTLTDAGTYYYAVAAIDVDTLTGDLSNVLSVTFKGSIDVPDSFSLILDTLDIKLDGNSDCLLWRSESAEGPFVPLQDKIDSSIYKQPAGIYYYKITRKIGEIESKLSSYTKMINYSPEFPESSSVSYWVHTYDDTLKSVLLWYKNPKVNKHNATYTLEESVNGGNYTPLCTMIVDSSEWMDRVYYSGKKAGTYRYRMSIAYGKQNAGFSQSYTKTYPGIDHSVSPVTSPSVGADYTGGLPFVWNDNAEIKYVSFTFMKGDSLLTYGSHGTYISASNYCIYRFNDEWTSGSNYGVRVNVTYFDQTAQSFYVGPFTFRNN